MDVSGYRAEAEEFLSAIDLEYYLHFAGRKDGFEIEPIYDRHITDERTAQAVIRAAQDSLAVDRAYRSALATAMAQIAESAAA